MTRSALAVLLLLGPVAAQAAPQCKQAELDAAVADAQRLAGQLRDSIDLGADFDEYQSAAKALTGLREGDPAVDDAVAEVSKEKGYPLREVALAPIRKLAPGNVQPRDYATDSMLSSTLRVVGEDLVAAKPKLGGEKGAKAAAVGGRLLRLSARRSLRELAERDAKNAMTVGDRLARTYEQYAQAGSVRLPEGLAQRLRSVGDLSDDCTKAAQEAAREDAERRKTWLDHSREWLHKKLQSGSSAPAGRRVQSGAPG